MGIRRLAHLITLGLVLATAGTASAALLPRAPSSRVIFDVNYVGDCGSTYCYTDYVVQFTPTGHGKFRRLKQRFGQTPGFTRDGHRVAYLDDRGRLIVASVRTGRRRTLARPNGSAAPSWSPGGQRIAFDLNPALGGRSFITTIGADGRGLRRLAQGDSPAWSPRGGIIAFTREVSRVDTLFTVPANGGPEHALGPGDYPDWSPQGDALAFDRDGRIWVAYPDGTHGRELAAGSMPRFSPDGRQIAFIDNDSAYVMDRDGHHKHEIADHSRLAALDDLVDDVSLFWLGWQPRLTSPMSASSSR